MDKALIQAVNERVNSTVKYVSDEALYARPEYWVEAGVLGDCEDYTLAKRRQLLDAGVPHSVMYFQTCYDETGMGHAVLRVRLPDTDVLLDNRFPNLMTPDEAKKVGYTFIAHIRSDGVGGWRKSI